MKLTINIPKDQIEPVCKNILKWRQLSPSPLTNFEELQKIEKELSNNLTSIILSSDTLDDVLIRL